MRWDEMSNKNTPLNWQCNRKSSIQFTWQTSSVCCLSVTVITLWVYQLVVVVVMVHGGSCGMQTEEWCSADGAGRPCRTTACQAGQAREGEGQTAGRDTRPIGRVWGGQYQLYHHIIHTHTHTHTHTCQSHSASQLSSLSGGEQGRLSVSKLIVLCCCIVHGDTYLHKCDRFLQL